MEEDPGRVRGQVGPDGQPCAFVHSILIVSSPARRIAAPRRTLWELKNTAQKDGLLQTLLLDNRVGKAYITCLRITYHVGTGVYYKRTTLYHYHRLEWLTDLVPGIAVDFEGGGGRDEGNPVEFLHIDCTSQSTLFEWTVAEIQSTWESRLRTRPISADSRQPPPLEYKVTDTAI